MPFTSEQVDLLLNLARDATTGDSFHERMAAISETLAVLVPLSSLSIVLANAAEQRIYMHNEDLSAGEDYAQVYRAHDPLLPIATASPGEPVSLRQAVPLRRWGEDAYTGEFLPRYRLKHVFGLVHPMPGDATLLVGIHRDSGQDMTHDEAELLRLAAPDVVRAASGAILHERIAALAARAEAAALTAGVILFDERGGVVHADDAALRCCRLLLDEDRFPADALVADARRLSASAALEGDRVERVLRLSDGALLRARSTALGRGRGARVATLVEPVARGAPAYFDALAAGAGLTPREREVAALAGEGLGNRMIARRLGISEVTVGVHLSSVYRKTGLTNRTELARALGRR